MASLAEALGLDATKSDDAKSLEALAELESLELDDTTSLKDFFKRMLETKAYRRSVYMRVATGTLPPAVESKMVDHVCGKIPDHVIVEDKSEDVSRLSIEELHERQARTIEAMKKILTTAHRDSQTPGN